MDILHLRFVLDPSIAFRAGASVVLSLLAPAIASAGSGERPIDRLDPVTRAKVLMALVGLVLLGLAMILLVWFGARMVRRYAGPPARSDPSGPGGRVNEDDWWKKPLVPTDQDLQDDA